nr:hypothetical protein [Croceibacterium selenioxidans]
MGAAAVFMRRRRKVSARAA